MNEEVVTLPAGRFRVLRDVAAGMPLVIGSTADDARPFLTLNPRLAPKLDAAVIRPLARRLLSAYYTARMFDRPAAAFARRHRRGGGHAVTYLFDWSPADGPFGASHCIDLRVLMGSFHDWAGSPAGCSMGPMPTFAFQVRSSRTEVKGELRQRNRRTSALGREAAATVGRRRVD
jgi:para-nitrobenzyl esterase